MKNSFFKNTLSSAVGFVIGFILLFFSLTVIIIFSSIIMSLSSDSGKIDKNSVLKIKFDFPITDKVNDDPFSELLKFNSSETTKNMNLLSFLNSIDNAINNENVRGIVLDMNNFISPGAASSKEIRDALNNFKKSGKFIYSYSTVYSQGAYYIASVADSVFVYPTGIVSFEGISSTTTFFKNSLEEIGIKPEVIRHGKFKAAVEPFLDNKMSDENKKQVSEIISDLWSVMTEDISISRNIDISKLNEIANNMTLTLQSNEIIDYGLVDAAIYPEDFELLISEKLGVDKNETEYISLNLLDESYKKSKNEIAVIYAEGGIDGNENNIHSGYTKTIKSAFEDKNVAAVVLRVNSPGGSALISDEILNQIKTSKKNKPLVISMGNVAASGGYYISCAADKILASENTITGSIGVFGLFFTAEELLKEKMKLDFENIKTNDFSDLGSIYRSLSEREKMLIQRSVKNTYNDFIKHVSEGRKMSLNNVDSIGQGRVWTGRAALNNGLVDSIGGIIDAINIASQLANIDDYVLIELPRKKTGFDAIIDNIETQSKISKIGVEKFYLDELKNKYLKMQGIQALLPIKFEIE
ncbi:MAG: signal peptide peptidase SppA [Bacteroidota bacterium]|nr:signal peptide peptidase SppA [Bacteroidota bacterium]